MATYDLTLGSTFSAAGKANTVAKLAESRKSAYMKFLRSLMARRLPLT